MRITPFDMMKEKTLVLEPAFVKVAEDHHGLPLINAWVEVKA